jgi:sulfur-oxidizing protein SoxZ
MSESSIRVQARLKDGITQVKALINHPMETGARKNAQGELVPAHFIEEVQCKHKDQLVMNAIWSAGISQNPYLSFNFKGGEVGDTLTVSWTDNLGKTDSVEAQIR